MNRPQLLKVYDVRETDENGKRLPLESGEGHTCSRCGRLHARVYVAECGEQTAEVGSTCCKRMFGWEPLREDIARALARSNAEKVTEIILADKNLPWMNQGARDRELARLSQKYPNWSWVYQYAHPLMLNGMKAMGL